MDLSSITRKISSMRAQTERDSITPDGLGTILQLIVNTIASLGSVDVEDEAAILSRITNLETDTETALQAAQAAQAGAAANVIDSLNASQGNNTVTISVKQHGHTALQKQLPVASSTGAGIITKQQAEALAELIAAGPSQKVLDAASFVKQQHATPVVLRNVTNTTFDDLATGDIYFDQGILFAHALGENGAPANLGAPSKRLIYFCLADAKFYRWGGSSFTAVSIAGADVPTKVSDLVNDLNFLQATNIKDDSDHIKQSVSAPVVLLNVTNTTLDNLVAGDIYFDQGQLFAHGLGTGGTPVNLGAPSKSLIYLCLEDGLFYRWGGSSFTQIEMPKGDAGAPGITPHIDPTTGNWFVGTTDTGIHAQGDTGNTQILDPTTFDPVTQIVNNLHQGGEGDALSAEMGKKIGDTVFNIASHNIKPTIDAATELECYINPSTGKWVSSSNYKCKIIPIPHIYRGCRIVMKCIQFSTNDYYFVRYAFLTSNAHESNVGASFCSGESVISNSGETATQYVEDTIPDDCEYLYIYAYSAGNPEAERDVTPRQATVYDNEPSSRIDRMEEAVDGVPLIKEDWFAVSGTPDDYEIQEAMVGKCQSIGSGEGYNGKIYTNTVGMVIPAAVNPVHGTVYTPSPSECFRVDELPDKVLTLKFPSITAPAKWILYIVMYSNSLEFLQRYEQMEFDANHLEKSFDFTSTETAKLCRYFKLQLYYKSDGSTTDDPATLSLTDGFCSFVRQPIAQESMPNRVSALESAVEELKGAGMYKFRIASWNVGHFSLGASATTSIDTQEEYETMRTKWREKLNEMSPDVLVMCEYSTVFADLATDVEAKDAIFCQYAYRAIGSVPQTARYMQTAQFSNIPISNTREVVYAHSVQVGRYYQVSDIMLGGVKAKLVITHLDFGRSDNDGDEYRAEQMQTLIDAFDNESHVIICGDFNNPLSSEWDVFAQAGYSMANHGYMGDLFTYPAGAAEKAIDNILVKGFAVSKVEIVDDATLTDHCGVVCDLTLI